MKLLMMAIAAVFAFVAPAAAQSTDRWKTQIEEASSRFGIPTDWIRRVIQAESGGRRMMDGQPIVSRAGAMGLMQLMPGTWREMRDLLGLGGDPHDPRDNILAGTAYLRAMYDRFGYPGLFAAYNAGPLRYAEHRSTGRRLPVETIAYVVNVSRGAAGAGPLHPLHARAPTLFAPLAAATTNPSDALTKPAGRVPNALFVLLSGDARR